MELPIQFRYQMSAKPFLLGIIFFGFCFVTLLRMAAENKDAVLLEGLIPLTPEQGSMFFSGLAWVSAAFVTVALIAFIKSRIIAKFIVLDEESMTLPHGLMLTKTAHIKYSDVLRLEERMISKQRFLYIYTRHGHYTMTQSMLPNAMMFADIKDLLTTHIPRAVF